MDRAEAIKKLNLIAWNFCNDGYDNEYEAVKVALNALREQEQRWVSVEERLPEEFVSVLGFMTDAEPFPPVRECYVAGGEFFFPALSEYHPVSHWMEMPEPPKEGAEG